MIRLVAFEKAAVAGIAGAVAWEVAVRLLIWAGLPMFDLVRVLGTMALGPESVVWMWWPAGLAMHVLVGAVWAIFYAYFFWSLIDVRPMLQGVFFSLFPALLAGFIMVPQMDLMLNGELPPLRVFAVGVGILGPVSIVLGHVAYGLVMGSIYVRPVGYRTGSKVVYG
jgi:hypothetical protein